MNGNAKVPRPLDAEIKDAIGVLKYSCAADEPHDFDRVCNLLQAHLSKPHKPKRQRTLVLSRNGKATRQRVRITNPELLKQLERLK